MHTIYHTSWALLPLLPECIYPSFAYSQLCHLTYCGPLLLVYLSRTPPRLVIHLSNFQDLDSKLQRQRILTALTIKWFPRNDSDWFRLPTSGKKKKEVRLLTTFLTRALKSIFSLFFSVCDLMEILYLQLHLVCSCTTLRSTSPLPLTPFSFLFHSRFNPHRSPNLHPLFPPPIPCPQDSFLCLFI